MDKKTKIEDLPVEAEQAAEVKGGWVSERRIFEPNSPGVLKTTSLIDPNM